ncbi:MAG: DUF1232 domain-containing protein [Psychrobium sp.]|nr:DUF1232 domain-containing protein [Psychrobium sp.]
MSLDITFKLQDSDLDYFREVMRKAQSGISNINEKEMLDNVRALAGEIKPGVPEFVAIRLKKLETLVSMIEDEEWAIPKESYTDVISALAYFSEPEDLIPDHIPVLGFLDDAIMIELVVEELKDDMNDYIEFCEYRAREEVRKDPDTITREEWLADKRSALHSRMRSRRSKRGGRGFSFKMF